MKKKLARKKRVSKSALDQKPPDLGRMKKPLGSREEWYDEMRFRSIKGHRVLTPTIHQADIAEEMFGND
jgi:hypothetical protein